jgi:hypothetical protein
MAIAYRCLIGSACLLFAALSACSSVSPDGKEWVPTPSENEGVGQVEQALTGTNKVCSAVVSGVFRDSIVVDNGWSATTCHGWAVSVGGTSWQLGCLFTNGFAWGAANGGRPSPNCGW